MSPRRSATTLRCEAEEIVRELREVGFELPDNVVDGLLATPQQAHDQVAVSRWSVLKCNVESDIVFYFHARADGGKLQKFKPCQLCLSFEWPRGTDIAQACLQLCAVFDVGPTADELREDEYEVRVAVLVDVP